ncbi:t-SNARE VTI1 [Taxawa tesnikishii (nom. ined.)]|nr:t-SNARE VTI1 [Dothideales sp. JES 119]
MSNPLDTDAGSELFSSYETELKLVQADLNQKLDQIGELTGEPRKAAIGRAERSLEEAKELVSRFDALGEGEPTSEPKTKTNQRFRNYQTDIDAAKRKLESLSSDRSALFGRRYKDNPTADDQLEQRQQLLSGTDRLERSSGRLRESQRIALETEDIGRNTLADLSRQRETIEHTRATLLESEGYTDRSNKTLRGWRAGTWARPSCTYFVQRADRHRMATNKIITIAIITVLVLLILAVIVSKFR